MDSKIFKEFYSSLLSLQTSLFVIISSKGDILLLSLVCYMCFCHYVMNSYTQKNIWNEKLIYEWDDEMAGRIAWEIE
jgi:Ca2+/Na+ antiporter